MPPQAGLPALVAGARRRAGALLLPLRLVTVAPTRADAARNGLAALLMPFAERALRGRRRRLPVAVAVDGCVHRFRADAVSDLHAITEVWVERVYDGPALAAAEVIVDVGANVGAAVAFFKARRPHARVHAYEPDPRAFVKLAANVGGLPGVTLHEEALGGADGTLTLYSSRQSWSSSAVRRPEGGSEPVTVRQSTLPSARARDGLPGVDLLKLDAEGAEFAILGVPGALDGVRDLVGELHPGFVPGAGLGELLALLDGFDVDVEDPEADQTTFSARRRAHAHPRSTTRTP